MATTLIDRPWLVQKYGGTSLGKLLDTICNNIIPSYSDDNNVIVVCSALSGTTKATGTTSLLLECISLAESGFAAQELLNRTIDIIRDNHLRVLDKYLANRDGTRNDVHATTAAALEEECESLRRFLLAAQIVRELSPRSKDRVIALGERLSCLITACFLASKGIAARALVLDDIVESVFGTAVHDQRTALEALGPDFYRALAEEIRRRIEACPGKIPVVTGFFGIMPDSLLKTVGRGYSDLCAALCALGVGAAELQIWKEVEGIFTADPRKVPSARLLSTVTAEEATELTYYGSEVIHPLTMDQICYANIPLRLKNVFNPKGPGTIIYPSLTSTNASSPLLDGPVEVDRKLCSPASGFLLENGYHGEQQERRRPTAVTVKESITLINVACNRNTKSQGFLAGVFNRLEDNRVPVDLVATSEGNVSLALQCPKDAQSQRRRLKADLEKYGKVTVSDNMSIITVVGHKMRNMVGISSEIMSALASAKINIYLVSQGASEINVSLVIRAEDAILGMNVIHGKVLKIATHWEKENSFIKGPWLY
ncbi:Aspartokinase [Pleurostoma richardsiae]|uniref:Aspartokinase n=1 Tax=Pleurostoma richardsiae TaxID=41990 RepID=A0AA38S1N3_9PEZI|nr:Aspartokinase [Pleurostoma richardsiae]